MPAKCSDQVARAMQLEMELSAIIPALCENNCPICPRLSNIAKLISKYCRYAAKSLHFAAVASSSNSNKMHAIIIQQQQKPHSYSTIALSFCWSLPKHKAQGARHLQCNQSSNIP
ncbi:uncharacterized protein LOC128863429 isoform X1 [Anastrepha ludens]|uniref:uncharacterized protein LOC128863429 isoform X1 n=1 Tax=Anastrepha ludens TaxID=28586 RepID=UPI0023B1FAF8|nr:uncharacterized protein LOC128863429 isoform X1 [Anastrepha ludens]